MNISSTGTSGLSSLYLQQLLGLSGNSALGTSSSSSDSSDSDVLTISAAAQSASGAKGTDPFKTDLTNLDSLISSGDLTSAKKAYQAMVDKMKEHGDVPSDFAAIGTALDSGDLTAAGTALDKVKTNASKAGSSTTSAASGDNPLKSDMEDLVALLQAGDTAGAKALFATIQSSAKGLDGSDSSLSSSVSAFTSALDSSDSSTTSSALDELLAKLQAQQGTGASSYAKAMETVAAAAYAANAGLGIS